MRFPKDAVLKRVMHTTKPHNSDSRKIIEAAKLLLVKNYYLVMSLNEFGRKGASLAQDVNDLR